MLAEIKIKLTTNFLGGGPRKHGVRQLKKTSENQIAINEQEWRSDSSEVAASLGIEFDPKSVRFESGFDCDRVSTLRRTYNKVNVEMFEGIPANTRLSLFVFLDSRIEPCLEGEDTLVFIQSIFVCPASLFVKYANITRNLRAVSRSLTSTCAGNSSVVFGVYLLSLNGSIPNLSGN